MERTGAVPYGRHRKTPRDTAAAVVVGVSAACMAVALTLLAVVAAVVGPAQRSPVVANSSPWTVVESAQPVAAATTAGPIVPGAAAYLDALRREGVPSEDTATLLVVADSVCTRRGDTSDSAQADRLMTAFPGRWTPQQAVTIVDCASKLACG